MLLNQNTQYESKSAQKESNWKRYHIEEDAALGKDAKRKVLHQVASDTPGKKCYPLCYLDSGTNVGYRYVSKCRLHLNIQFYA